MTQATETHSLTPVDALDSSGPLESARRCTALARRTGERCRKAPIIGATVCRSHGGAAPQVRAAAHRRVVEAEAAALVAERGITPTTDPVASLLRVCGEMEALSSALRDRVAHLNDITTTDKTGAQDVVAELSAYERSLDRLARTLVAINRLGLQERHLDIEQAKLQLMAQAVRRAVFSQEARLDFDTGQRVLSAISTELSALSTAA